MGAGPTDTKHMVTGTIENSLYAAYFEDAPILTPILFKRAVEDVSVALGGLSGSTINTYKIDAHLVTDDLAAEIGLRLAYMQQIPIDGEEVWRPVYRPQEKVDRDNLWFKEEIQVSNYGRMRGVYGFPLNIMISGSADREDELAPYVVIPTVYHYKFSPVLRTQLIRAEMLVEGAFRKEYPERFPPIPEHKHGMVRVRHWIHEDGNILNNAVENIRVEWVYLPERMESGDLRAPVNYIKPANLHVPRLETYVLGQPGLKNYLPQVMKRADEVRKEAQEKFEQQRKEPPYSIMGSE